VLGELTRFSKYGLLRSQLCRQGEPSQSSVQTVLNPPGGVFPFCVKSKTTKGMSNDVVNCSKSVIGTARPAIENGMKPVAIRRRDRDLESVLIDDSCYQFLVGTVGFLKECEDDFDATGSCPVGQKLKEVVCLLLELSVSGDNPRIIWCASRLQMPNG